MLDMGEPVRIVDLARDMIRLYGADPDHVAIVFTGLRPGEKLYEEPLASEEATQADAASEAAHRAGARGRSRRGEADGRVVRARPRRRRRRGAGADARMDPGIRPARGRVDQADSD